LAQKSKTNAGSVRDFIEPYRDFQICSLCKEKNPGKKWQRRDRGAFSLKTATGNFKYHMKHFHSITFESSSEKPENELPSFVTKSLTDDQKSLLREWIVSDSQPFSVVSHPKLKKLFNSLGYALPSRQFVKNDIVRDYGQQLNRVKQLIDMAGKISLTLDMWTSAAGRSYVITTAHFIDFEWKKHNLVIDFDCLQHLHDADTIAKYIVDLAVSFRFDNKLISITTDNGQNIVKGAKEAINIIRRSNDESEIFHVRCLAHVLNIIVKKFFEVIKDLMGNIRKVS
jgi:hypothetical protein